VNDAGKRKELDKIQSAARAAAIAGGVRPGATIPDQRGARRAPGDTLGVGHGARPPAAPVDLGKALRRKIAWAVGSVYGVKYQRFDSWPQEYARRASERLIELHGAP